jgi:thiosulfate reductase cytochrome b subunit
MANIPQQIVNALTPLAQKLGLAVTQIFGWYVRATFIRGWFLAGVSFFLALGTIGFLAMGLSGAKLWNQTGRLFQEWNKARKDGLLQDQGQSVNDAWERYYDHQDRELVLMCIGFPLAILCGIFFCVTLRGAILDIFVPQYGAFHEILRQIGR